MKKYIIGLMLAASIYNSQAITATAVVNGGTMTNIVTGSALISSIIVTSGTNQTINIVDSFTNKYILSQSAYTNIISYATNAPAFYTNYFGVTTTLTNQVGTNFVLVDVTNVVAASSLVLPYIQVTTTSNQTTTINNIGTYYVRGVWVTNTAPTPAPTTVTVVYTVQ